MKRKIYPGTYWAYFSKLLRWRVVEIDEHGMIHFIGTNKTEATEARADIVSSLIRIDAPQQEFPF